MKYGHFDDDAREYVVETPHTPLPWINYLGSESFFGLISNTGGGYSFYKDARLRRLTRYRYNNVPADTGGRMYYIAESGAQVFCPCYLPAKTPLDRYVCRHGLGYTTFEASKNALSSRLTCFVPLGADCEVHHLTLTNDSKESKVVHLWSAVEWCLWDAVDDANNYQRNLNIAEVEADGSVLYHKTEYRERRDHYAFFSVNAPIVGFDTSRDDFLGPQNGWDAPRAITTGQSTDQCVTGGYPIASHHLVLSLHPGESKDFVFLLGYAENPREEKFSSRGVIRKDGAAALLRRFSSAADVADALAALRAHWDALLSRFQIQSGRETLDRMVNIWHQYQCMVTFNMSRSASYYETGTGRGMGFRDSCQDLLGFVHLIPERARARILDIASVQLADGGAHHQYQPLTKRGNAALGTGFNDDPLWLVACTSAYIRETGDSAILKERVPFESVPGSEQPLFEHLRRSMRYTLTHLGLHGLPLIGRADWNDCLNLNCFSEDPGESFQTCANFESGVAESVFIAAMFVFYGRDYVELCRRYGDAAEGEQIEQDIARMEQAVCDSGWDGAWYLRAYDAFGKPVGSHTCEEGQIFIEPQGFCSMARIGASLDYPSKALNSVKERLTTPYGACLLVPPYTVYHKELGEITSYPPGLKENGSIFCHNNPWVSIAEALNGNAEEAFEVYRRTCPAEREDIVDIHRTEPYVYSQTIAGIASPRFGEARNSWLTGTAAWAFVNISQYILGIYPHYDGLSLRPVLPAHIKGYKATRVFRGTTYHIEVLHTGEKTPKLVVDGHEIPGQLIPPTRSESPCIVRFTY